MQAINEMDGESIDGRVVRVGEVRTRGGRSNFGHETSRRNSERDIDGDRSISREKDHDRAQYRDNNREWPCELDEERKRYDNIRDGDRSRDHLPDRDRIHDQDKLSDNVARECERIHEYEWKRDWDLDKELERTNNHHKSAERDKDLTPKLLRSYSDEHGKRDCLSDASNDDHVEVMKQLEISNQKFQELQKEICQMEKLAEEKKCICSEAAGEIQVKQMLPASKRLQQKTSTPRTGASVSC